MERTTNLKKEEVIMVYSNNFNELIMAQKNYGQLLALYSIYYYTSKLQKTNIIKATNEYVSKSALNWSEDTVKKYKSELIKLGLIENIVIKNKSNARFAGHYIKVNFI